MPRPGYRALLSGGGSFGPGGAARRVGKFLGSGPGGFCEDPLRDPDRRRSENPHRLPGQVQHLPLHPVLRRIQEASTAPDLQRQDRARRFQPDGQGRPEVRAGPGAVPGSGDPGQPHPQPPSPDLRPGGGGDDFGPYPARPQSAHRRRLSDGTVPVPRVLEFVLDGGRGRLYFGGLQAVPGSGVPAGRATGTRPRRRPRGR